MKPPPCPTSEQCSANVRVTWHDGEATREGFACWYPQIGGYSGACVVEIEPTADGGFCFTAFVWHDGEFPFDGENGRAPVVLHHCSAEQFIDFGELVLAKASGR